MASVSWTSFTVIHGVIGSMGGVWIEVVPTKDLPHWTEKLAAARAASDLVSFYGRWRLVLLTDGGWVAIKTSHGAPIPLSRKFSKAMAHAYARSDLGLYNWDDV